MIKTVKAVKTVSKASFIKNVHIHVWDGLFDIRFWHFVEKNSFPTGAEN